MGRVGTEKTRTEGEEVSATNCARGCIDARRHAEDCGGDCRGCAPRAATNGALCESCHVTLVDILRNAPGQVALLRASTDPTRTPTPSPQPTHGKVGPRLSDGTPHYIAAARAAMSATDREAIRTACLDVAQQVEDSISAIVEALCQDYRESGPAKVQTAAERDDPRVLKWHPAYPDGRPTFRVDQLVTRHGDDGEVMQGQYVWTDPPTRFEVGDACRWLRENLPRLEHQPGIGDDLEHLSDVMARAHSLAPWRSPSEPMRGVPCPQCHRMSLHFFPDSAMAKCQAALCGKAYPWARIAIWTRVLEDDRASGQRPGASWTSERGAS